MNRLSVHLGLLSSYAFPILLLSSLYSCGQKPTASGLDSVVIEQTPVENQFSIGFCWSYATIGLIESNYKARTGQSINLSEEALGFARMKEEMLQLANSYRRGRISLEQALNATQGDGLEGWFVRTGNFDHTRDAMELVDEYGVVPESSWNVKFKRQSETEQLKLSILDPFRSLLTSDAAITPDAIDQVLTAPGAFPAAPPKTIQFDRQTTTPVALARDILKFSSRDYIALQASDAAASLELIQIMKRAMAAGHSVPLSFAVSFGNLKSGFFKAPNYGITDLDSNPTLAQSLVQTSGGHAVLATDFVNQGGQEGAIRDDMLELEVEVEKDAEQLSYLKFKNSWGAQGTTNERGISVSGSRDGYYRMDLGYIKAIAALGHFGIVVPRSFAE